MPEVFTYSFMQRTFLVGNIIAVIAPLIGVFLILKRLSLIGNTISHIALAGVAMGLLLGIYPVFLAILFSVLAALGIEKIRSRFNDYAELSLSIILAAGLGIAAILIGMLKNSTGIMSYLFGSLTIVSTQDLYVVIPMAIVILLVIFVFYYGFFFLSFNEKEARLAGIPVRFLNLSFMIIIAVTVSLSMRIVGGLLIASLISIPVASALQLARSFKETIFLSVMAGVLSVNTGLISSYYLDLAPGGTIIIVNILFFLLALFLKFLKKRGRV
ncbi:MAG: metal ABC transporter permease [Halanaerobiaceae bacterium]|jgi:zinc transport system permease protein|nr:metal ABC transporter permease [Halanaerobiaceae bacterium]